MARIDAGSLTLVLFGASEARALMQAVSAPHAGSDEAETARALRRAQVAGVTVAVAFGLAASAATDSAWPFLVAVATAALLCYEHERAIRNQSGRVEGSGFGSVDSAGA